MIDFDKGIEKFSKFRGSEKKVAVLYENELYMIKYPDRIREKKIQMSYKNNHFSEHIGCQIFRSCGFETQETTLGYFTNDMGNKKIVVGCKDFTQDGSTLLEFGSLANAIEDFDNQRSTTIENVNIVIEKHKLIKNKDEVKGRFWDMFVIDALLANKDRHLGNWGLLEKGDEIKFSPIYDCGSTLSALLTDEEMKTGLSDPIEFKNKEFNASSCYKVGGKRIFYHEIFQNPPKELEEAIKRTVPKINMEKIHSIIDSVDEISNVRKEYLKKSLDVRYKQIIEPALNRVLQQEKEIGAENLNIRRHKGEGFPRS